MSLDKIYLQILEESTLEDFTSKVNNETRSFRIFGNFIETITRLKGVDPELVDDMIENARAYNNSGDIDGLRSYVISSYGKLLEDQTPISDASMLKVQSTGVFMFKFSRGMSDPLLLEATYATSIQGVPKHIVLRSAAMSMLDYCTRFALDRGIKGDLKRFRKTVETPDDILDFSVDDFYMSGLDPMTEEDENDEDYRDWDRDKISVVDDQLQTIINEYGDLLGPLLFQS